MTVWLTADHHFGHKNIIKYCDRPFNSVDDMDIALADEWNKVVDRNDTVYHLGDFTLYGYDDFYCYIGDLNGRIVFIPGGHDYRWVNSSFWERDSVPGIKIENSLLTIEIDSHIIVLCHYAMRVWDRSHYNSWQLYGHSHGELEPVGKQMDVGVDNAYKLFGKYRPISLREVTGYMSNQPDNHNYIQKGD